jgi:hypothetical protein
MDKAVEVVYSSEVETVLDYLKEKAPHSKKEKSILNAIESKTEIIKSNFFYGEPISRKLIPHIYMDRYNIDNLYRVELPSYWRMLYSLKDREVKIIAFIIDVVDHKDYSRKFGYKK